VTLEVGSHAHCLARTYQPVPLRRKSFPQPVKPVPFKLNHLNGRSAAYGHLHGNRFQLRQVIQIVTGHGFNELAKGHFPALRMENGL
jgi:hypothetical protein